MFGSYLFIVFLSLHLTNASRYKEKGLFAVFDYETDEDVGKGKPPPSCIIAGMKAHLKLFHDLNDENRNSTVLKLLHNAWAKNHTCHLRSPHGEKRQKLKLLWKNDPIMADGGLSEYRSSKFSSLTFHFGQRTEDNDEIHNFLDYVHLNMITETRQGKYRLEAFSQRNLNYMDVPRLFAFVCPRPFNISMNVKVNEINGNSSSRSISAKALLYLNDLRVEVFREKRFYEDITHLKYFCDLGWPYGWVPIATFIFVLCFGLLCVSVFIFNYIRNSKKRKSNYKPISEK